MVTFNPLGLEAGDDMGKGRPNSQWTSRTRFHRPAFLNGGAGRCADFTTGRDCQNGSIKV